MSVRVADQVPPRGELDQPALTDPARKLPASPEAPGASEPTGAASLEGEASISLEPPAKTVVQASGRSGR